MNAPKQLCATFTSANSGTFVFSAMAKGTCAKEVSTSCQTKVIGISALLLEKADHPDPIEVGETTTYTVKVTNQGTADDINRLLGGIADFLYDGLGYDLLAQYVDPGSPRTTARRSPLRPGPER